MEILIDPINDTLHRECIAFLEHSREGNTDGSLLAIFANIEEHWLERIRSGDVLPFPDLSDEVLGGDDMDLRHARRWIAALAKTLDARKDAVYLE